MSTSGQTSNGAQKQALKMMTAEERSAYLNQEMLDSTLFGMLTAKPVYSDEGEVVDFEYLNANPALYRYHGVNPEDVIGKRMLDVFPDLRDHPTLQFYKDVAVSGNPAAFESEFVTRDLDAYMLVSITRTHAEFITISFVEVSETKRIMDALSRLNAFSASDMNLDDYIENVLSLGRKTFYATHAYRVHCQGDLCRTVSVSVAEEEVDSKDVLLPETISDQLMREGRIVSFRHVADDKTTKDRAEEIRPFLNFIGAPVSVSSEISGALAFCSNRPRARDYTDNELELAKTLGEAVATRIRLNGARLLLEQRNDDLKRFSTVVSHDLKAPMRHMKLLSELLMDRIKDDEEAQALGQEICDNAAEAQAMIKALRDFSELGDSGVTLEKVDLEALCGQCVSRYAEEIQACNAEVEFGRLPPVIADRILLGQVISNLLANALKYARSENLKITFDCETTMMGQSVYSITDNGPGIDARYAERVFELFRQLPGSKANGDGEGVGLAACRKIIDGLGGRIWLDTTYQSGARFCFTLPASN
tara:strand:- start:1367 stop:2968 length:1602 start_codon:yes stop_codon:yes gene_type:complete